MVSAILDNLAAGVPQAEIVKSYPATQESDIQPPSLMRPNSRAKARRPFLWNILFEA